MSCPRRIAIGARALDPAVRIARKVSGSDGEDHAAKPEAQLSPEPRGDEDWALKELDIDWSDGGAYALLGPSGCGKTTLLNIISGLVRPTEGRVLFDDRDVTDVPTDRRHIAQVFQFPVVYDTMTVYDNLAFPLRNRGLRESEVDRESPRDRPHARPRAHAGRSAPRASRADGKQKISLGRGLVRSDVNVIMFDEPLTVIDPHLKCAAALEAQGAAPAHCADDDLRHPRPDRGADLRRRRWW